MRNTRLWRDIGLIAGPVAAAMAVAPFFPGTAGSDPEFAGLAGRPLGLAPQQLVTYGLCTLVLVAVAAFVGLLTAR